MPSLVSSQPLPSVSIGYCDKNGLTPKINPPKGACDGGGLTARPTMPRGAMSFSDNTGDVRDVVGTGASAQTGISKKTGVIATAVLLIGGAILGYGHRDQISKGLDKMKGSVTEFFSKGEPAKWLEKGNEFLAKAKDMIFAKA